MSLRKVIIVDDHDIFNIGLTISIEKDEFFRVIKAAHTGEEALVFINKNECDLLICDYVLTGIDGITTLGKAKKIKPQLKTILISSLEKFELQSLCEKNRIDAYIFKSEARSKIVEVANLIFQNKKFRPIQISEENHNNPFAKLSSKELIILRLWMLGRTLQDTAEDLKINSKTVETHRTNIKKKFPSLSKEAIFALMKKNGIV
jgi:DNA-binding NarL/FixJ family response regulator